MKSRENDSQDENNWHYHFISHLCAHKHTPSETYKAVCMKANTVTQSLVLLKRVANDTVNLLHF